MVGTEFLYYGTTYLRKICDLSGRLHSPTKVERKKFLGAEEEVTKIVSNANAHLEKLDRRAGGRKLLTPK